MDAECRLSPLTLVVGRNNVGKSNFLRAFQGYASHFIGVLNPAGVDLTDDSHYQTRHLEDEQPPVSITVQWPDGRKLGADSQKGVVLDNAELPFLAIPEVYNLDPSMIGGPEPAEVAKGVVPKVLPDGKGVTAVLRMLLLGTSAMQARFRRIESQWKACLPEIRTLHLAPTGPSQLMVEQHK